MRQTASSSRGILELSKQARTLVSAIESHYSDFKVMPSDDFYPWIIRHSAWLLTRYLVKADGKTPYERLRGREFEGEIVEPFDTVHYKIENKLKGKLDKQAADRCGNLAGQVPMSSDEHFIGTDQGIRRCRSVHRRPEAQRWKKEILLKIRGMPWQPRGTPTVVPGTPDPIRRKPRSVYITAARQIKHGATPGCPGRFCSDENPKPHNTERRRRFEQVFAVEKKVAPQLPGPGAGDIAPEPSMAETPHRRRRTRETAPQGAGDIAPHAGSTGDGCG